MKRVILPGVFLKEFIPVASLLAPRDILVPMILVSILAQIFYNLQGILTFKEIQKLPSVKLYSNVLLFGFSSHSLSIISSISKTLKEDTKSFSFLSNIERFSYLYALKESLFLSKRDYNSEIKNTAYNSLSELKRRRHQLSLQFRTSLQSAASMYPNSITFALSINEINLKCIIRSAKRFWVELGLLEQDFSFLLVKEFFNSSNIFRLRNNCFSEILEIEAVKYLFKLELENFCSFSDFLTFDRDFVVFNSDDNMVNLEKDLGFLKREYVEFFNYN